jgi:hypothetical protein
MEQAGMVDIANNKTESLGAAWLDALGGRHGPENSGRRDHDLAATLLVYGPPPSEPVSDHDDLEHYLALGFNVFALLLALIPYKRGERWSWYALWMLPLLWLSLFALGPETRSTRSNSPHA